MSGATLRENLDKMHRWAFGAEGEFGKGVARELAQQVSDALAAQAVSLPDREALIDVFRKTRCIASPRLERGYGCPVPEEAERMADAVLAVVRS